MEPIRSSLADLLQRYLDGTITTPESEMLFAALRENRMEEDAGLEAVLHENYDAAFAQKPVLTADMSRQILDRLLLSINHTIEDETRPVPLLRRLWFRYAAAAVMIAALGLTWVLLTDRKPRPQAARLVTEMGKATGGNHAVLKLAGGQEILLDSAHGNIRNAGFKASNDSGLLHYENNATAVEYHTLSTPRGGQYKLQLPDGTDVWLNAASSITYPTAFREKDRNVRITGEVYFEVADQEQPFKVNINDHLRVEVLGTRFNVNAYTDESSIRTTLLEGRVRMAYDQQTMILRPGQQVRIANGKMNVADYPDPDMTIAWKNGSFRFERTRLDEVLRQMARWYDVDVVYEKQVPDIVFTGEIKRELNLSQALIILEKMGVHFRITGKQLIVMP
ncbi:MAG: FecR domain-containing protein [Chitinophaga sp.]|uniref:FecR family protein n=1 Tax=Chitinophaga sp. TaxID=1869181 RepID=UPI001B0A6443|nr:FecR family protein [Chitinophaga sp.]MBO9728517.1 FecR domain-containing protein [Chitinophaga sp.]